MISTYNQVCPVVFGMGSISSIGENIKGLGGTKAFCIYDQGVKMAGIAEKVTRVLSESKIEYAVYEDIQADPMDSIVDEAADRAKEAKADIVIGIGGGSSLDAAKAVSVLLKNTGKIADYFMEDGGQFTETAPLILLPTASGTGSEVTPMAVITDTGKGQKKTILKHADIALVDPEFTVTVPPHVTASTGFDALSHAVEAYTVNDKYANPLSDTLALKAMQLISQNLEKAYRDGSDLDARTALSLGSNFAGLAFGGSSVHFGHCAAHELGSRFHIAHGALCAIALPEVIEFSAKTMPKRILDIAKATGVGIDEGIGGEEAGKIIADAIRRRMKAMNVKALRDYELTREQVMDCAESAVTNNWFIICAPEKIGAEKMRELLGRMYDNY